MKKYKLVVDGEIHIQHDNLGWLCDKAAVIMKIAPWAKVSVDKNEEVK